MNEAETRAELIDPALREAGWGVVEGSRVRREYRITLGRLQGAAGWRNKPDIADYVLEYRGRAVAVVEAKQAGLAVTEGLGQAKKYADKLRLRHAFSTNGKGIYQVDMLTGREGPVEIWPTPEELWALVRPSVASSAGIDRGGPDGATLKRGGTDWGERFGAIPFEDKSGSWQPRYYQDLAIQRVLDAVAGNKQRILLTLATGTGKTAIAFQVAWKLFHARWNLRRDGERRPRILFLADRNILADQAYNAFSSFPEDALVRIDPASIRKKGKVPTNGSVFFTIFQTFMSGPGDTPYFGEYPSDFFDFIIIDECHRGGANDESTWRAILEYFSPAVQLGLTATPKRDVNVDTYRYFGEPVYIYSLKEGINDGFLTPFKLRQYTTTLDEYMYTSDDRVVEGEAEAGKRYTEADFNRIIEIKQRETYRVKLFMDEIDQRQKTLVFCATQEHALAVRDLINQCKTSTDPNYCHRVTADDGEVGEQHLRDFQDNERNSPIILTTSQKLSTGVDARNVRNIVLMRPVNSMIEFKQIVGRGTRLYEGKDYFTIYDFTKAHAHFADPEWDGEPLEPELRGTGRPEVHYPEPGPDEAFADPPGEEPKRMTRVTLADGKERLIRHTAQTSFWGADGRPVSASEFIRQLFGELPQFFRDEEELRRLWSAPDTRKKLLDGLAEKGFPPSQLVELQRIIDAEKSDLFDVLAYIAYDKGMKDRKERADAARALLTSYNDKQRAFLDFVLDQYVQDGVQELNEEKLPPLLVLKYRSIPDAVKEMGDIATIRESFTGFQRWLYMRA
ncbi:MAG: DEAD/DEAH box helicase family protein [Flavobacteriales bacterium]|nr:DEAD/DEAH box helicase family protein [Flavobacteriales bacterium]MEB2340883.1 DEAD/DEAH box helicase family protein [Flavobacteriia bacterium]